TLPVKFSGMVIGNEVLDAMPVHIVEWRDDGIFERGVSWQEGRCVWQARPASGSVLELAQRLPVAAPYVSEISPAACAWIATWADVLERGALLLIDYGFPRAEYYHPQRSQGTLMC